MVEEKDAVKANVLKLLKEKYDIEEEDFVSAEIEVVPSGKARDYGLIVQWWQDMVMMIVCVLILHYSYFR